MINTKTAITIEVSELKHLRFIMDDGEQVAILVDGTGHEIIKGYGNNIVAAINDLHRNLI